MKAMAAALAFRAPDEVEGPDVMLAVSHVVAHAEAQLGTWESDIKQQGCNVSNPPVQSQPLQLMCRIPSGPNLFTAALIKKGRPFIARGSSACLPA
jgi:hypothetical protein